MKQKIRERIKRVLLPLLAGVVLSQVVFTPLSVIAQATPVDGRVVRMNVALTEVDERIVNLGTFVIQLRSSGSNPVDLKRETDVIHNAEGSRASARAEFRSPELVSGQQYTACIFTLTQIDNSTKWCATGTKGSDNAPLNLSLSLDFKEVYDTYARGQNNIPGDGDSEEADCEVALANPLSWFLCPIVTLLFEGINFFYQKVVLPFLVVDPLNAAAADPLSAEAATYRIWNSFRIIANILFVILFLVAIFGQATSFIFTPYELKKILPRLFICIVAVQLSWYMVGFVIDGINIIGAGMRMLILAPVQGLDLGLTVDFESNWAELAGVLGIVGTGFALWWVGGIMTGLPLVLFPILLGLVTAVLVLILRKVLILLLIVTAPVAFVLGVLPNTDGILKKWWSFFSKALMMYPIIVAFLAAGELFSKILVAQNRDPATGQAENAFIAIVSIIAFFAPFFLIPWTFQFAGGLLTSLSDGVGKLGKAYNNRLFGDARDQFSWRGRRAKRSADRQLQLSGRLRHNLVNNQAARKKGRKQGGLGRFSGRWRFMNPKYYAGGAMQFGINRGVLRPNSEVMGDLLHTAEQKRKNVIQNARDAIIYAATGKHVLHEYDPNDPEKSRIDREAVLAARATGATKSLADIEQSVFYSLTKAGNKKERDRAIDNWFNAKEGKGRRKRHVFAPNLNDHERAHVMQGVTRHISENYGDMEFFDWHDGQAIGVSKDLAVQNKYLRDANTRKTGYRLNSQREPYFNGLQEVANNFERLSSQATYSTLPPTQQQHVDLMGKQLRDLHKSLNVDTAQGGPMKANAAQLQLQRQLADMKQRGIL